MSVLSISLPVFGIIFTGYIAAGILSGLDFQTNENSMHLWLKLPEPLRANQLTETLRKHEISVIPNEHFSVDRGNPTHAIRICLSSVDNIGLLEEGLRKLRCFMDD